MRFLILLSVFCTTAAWGADTFEAFSDRIRDAYASRDAAKFKALYDAKDASPAAIEAVNAAVKSRLADPGEITAITSIPIFTEGYLPQIAQGKIFYLPRRPKGFCLVQFAKNAADLTGTCAPYAEIDGTFYLLAGDSAILPGAPEKAASYSISVNPRPAGTFMPPGVAIFKVGKAVSWTPVSGSTGFWGTEIVSLCIPPSPTAKTYEVDIRKGAEKLARRNFDAAQGVLWTNVEKTRGP